MESLKVLHINWCYFERIINDKLYSIVSGNRIREFKLYSEQMKVLRTTTNSMDVENIINIPPSESKTTFNTFLTEFGVYYPLFQPDITTFMESNWNVFDIIPDKIYLSYRTPFPLTNDDRDHPIFKLNNLLIKSCDLFWSFRSIINFSTQKLMKLQMECLTTFNQINLSNIAMVHLMIQVGNNHVPLTFIQHGLRDNYHCFINSEHKSDPASRTFIKDFSFSFHQTLICKSNSFFMYDGDFILAVVLDPNPMDNSSLDLSNVHGIKCKIFLFDAKLEPYYISIFIIVFAIAYAKTIPEPMVTRLADAFNQTERQRQLQWEKNYQLLEKFATIISTVPPSDSLPKSLKHIKIKDIETMIRNEFNSDISLSQVSKIINNFVFRDASSINIRSIINGEYFQHNRSIVIEDTDGFIYKIFDPVRCKVSNNDSLHDRINILFEPFIREVLTHTFINDFQFKPKCLEFGYIKNNNKTFLNTLGYGVHTSLSGFYIKMMQKQAYNLNLFWRKDLAPKLRLILKHLHHYKVSHGDIHPGNFLCDPRTESVSMIDFGKSNHAFMRVNGSISKTEDRKRIQELMDQDTKDLEIMINNQNSKNDPKVSKVYFDGLKELEELLEVVDFDEIHPFTTQLKKKFKPAEIKVIIPRLYKVFNSHYISNDLDTQDLKWFQRKKLLYDGVVNDYLSILPSDDDKMSAILFKFYSEQLKSLRSTVSMSDIPGRNNLYNTGAKGSARDSGFNDEDCEHDYRVSGDIFKECGFFYPLSQEPITTLIESNLYIHDIIPHNIDELEFERYPELPYNDSEDAIEVYLYSLLTSTCNIFLEFKSFIKILYRELVNSNMEALHPLIIMAHSMIEFRHNRIPLRITDNGLGVNYQTFINSKEKEDTQSKTFIEDFSKSYYQSIICKSNSFLMYDGEFIIGVVLDSNPLGDASPSNLHGVKCKIFTYDAKLEPFSIALFIIIFAITYARTIPDPMIARLIDSFNHTNK
ncbi:hypothetical protein DFJ63DRAFT_337197 [Scheffersomyces coipomensis]|uniref:uncharacterized protein n=1 Tax=Scheffersomyces coipomensis TaxID=1788519 RepID=UPI00315CE788